MKTYLISLLILGAAVAARAQSNTVDLDFLVGVLTDQNSNPIPDGSLLQVVGSHDGTFGLPTLTDFLGGDANDYVLANVSFDSTGLGIPGAMEIDLSNLVVGTDPSGLEAGDALEVRWFPTLTAASDPSAPGATTYGQYGYADDDTWVVPAAGGYSSYQLLTIDGVGGNQTDAQGAAGFSTAAVPDAAPTALLLALALAGLFCLRPRHSQLPGV